MILDALSYNRKGYFPASLSALIILPVHAFKGSFQLKPPPKESARSASPLNHLLQTQTNQPLIPLMIWLF